MRITHARRCGDGALYAAATAAVMSLAATPCYAYPYFPLPEAVSTVPIAQSPSGKRVVSDFQAALDILARENRTAIVAEGAPLHFDAAVMRGDAYRKAAPPERLRLVAAEADYDLARTRGGGVFVLTKRYTSPRDVAGVTLEECRESVRAIRKMMDPLLPPPPTRGDPLRPPVLAVVQGMTQDHMRAMDADESIPLARLAPAQRQAVRDLCALLYLDSMNTPAGLAERNLGWATSPGTRLNKRVVVNGQSALAVQPEGTPVAEAWALGGGASNAWREVPQPGQTLPAPAPTTLGREVERLNARRKSAGQPPLDLPPMYAEKPLIVANVEGVAADHAAEALAAAYGLRVRTTTFAPLPFRDRTITLLNVGEAIAAAMPAPFARMILGQRPTDANLGEVERSAPVYVQRALTMANRMRAAGQLLRLSVEARIDASGGEGVPVADLSAADRSAVATLLLMTFLEAAARRLSQQSLPNYVTRMDDLHVRVKPEPTPGEDGKPRLQLDLFYRDTDGTLVRTATLANVHAADPAVR